MKYQLITNLSLVLIIQIGISYCHYIPKSKISGNELFDDSWMHSGAKRPYTSRQGKKMDFFNYLSAVDIVAANEEQLNPKEDEEYWRRHAQDTLRGALRHQKIEAEAKNSILFLGDGLSLTTVATARILKGQLDGRSGEEGSLYFETFPNLALSKTFCTDGQVPDSACTATAYLSGTKANMYTIGVSPRVQLNDCKAQMDPKNQLNSIIKWAQDAGKSTGVITNTRITHASPAGAYAHISNRDFESDGKVTEVKEDPDSCDDISEQLILNDPGRNINVVMGGGRLHFLPNTVDDFESKTPGYRQDGKNLIDTWKTQMDAASRNAAYVTSAKALRDMDLDNIDYLLGLFAPDHLGYSDELNQNDDPTLEEMVTAALKILIRNPKGFVLFVEGGRIDHAHHANMARRALIETIEFDKAIRKADMITSDDDTLIVVTSDHSHVMTFNGYPDRGNDILGFGGHEKTDQAYPYTTLSYTNGPGYRKPETSNDGCRRGDISKDNTADIAYRQESMLYVKDETHGGDDVGIFAKGPFAHLYSGTHYQSYIPHVMAYASCIGPGERYCSRVQTI